MKPWEKDRGALLWKVCTRAGKSFYRDPDGKKVDYAAAAHGKSRAARTVAVAVIGPVELCSSTVLHASRFLVDALDFGYLCSRERNPHFSVFRVRGTVEIHDYDKVGCQSLEVVAGPYSVRAARKLAAAEGSCDQEI